MSSKETLQYLRRYSFLTLSLIAIQVGATAYATDESGDIFQSLSESQKESVSRLCAPLQFNGIDSDEGYRQCILEKAELADAVSQTSSAELSTLPFNERYAIQQACVNSGPISTPARLECSFSELVDLQKEPEPLLSHIMTDEADIVARQCLESQKDVGARAYRICVNEEILNLTALPIADFSGRDAQERSDIKSECATNSTTAGEYRTCLLSTLTGYNPDNQLAATTTEQQTTPAVTSIIAIRNTAEGSDTTSATAGSESLASVDQQAETDESLDTLTAQRAASDSTLNSQQDEENALDVEEAAAQSQATDLNNQNSSPQTENTPSAWVSHQVASNIPRLILAQNKFQSLTLGLKAALIFALTLPLLVILIFVSRRNEPVDYMIAQTDRSQTHHASDVDTKGNAKKPSKPDLTPTKVTDSNDSNPAYNRETSEMTPNFNDTVNAQMSPSNSHDEPAENLILDETYLGNMSESHQKTADQKDSQTSANRHVEPVSADGIKSSAWLDNYSREEQLEYAIEFLIYWMAYNDNRYDPETKKRVMRAKNVDHQTLIKRLAFMKDAYAFTATVSLLQKQTNFEQRQQILDLLMALLISENALTPIQNNILRFLADAFGIGNAGISQQFQQAYGHPMPPIPRPDKALWWDQQPENKKIRWDVRAINRLPQLIRQRLSLIHI